MKLFKQIYKIFILLWRLNIAKTIYFNFKMLPLVQAIRLPVLLYGKICLLKLSGHLMLQDGVRTGMVRIGYRWIDLWPLSFLPTQIQIMGTIQFHGDAIISGGANINVQHKDAMLKIGAFVVIGGGSVVKCLDHISIGNNTRITGNCTIMDCNMHYVKNVNDGTVANYKSPISIGKNCWINYGTVIGKGAVVPDYSVTSRNSYVSKNFAHLGSNLFLVGSPAVPTSTRVQRLFTVEKQNMCSNYFKTHNDKYLQLNPGLEIEDGHLEGF